MESEGSLACSLSWAIWIRSKSLTRFGKTCFKNILLSAPGIHEWDFYAVISMLTTCPTLLILSILGVQYKLRSPSQRFLPASRHFVSDVSERLLNSLKLYSVHVWDHSSICFNLQVSDRRESKRFWIAWWLYLELLSTSCCNRLFRSCWISTLK